MKVQHIIGGVALATTARAQCPDYLDYAKEYHAPFSTGRYNLSYQRPGENCRTFKSQDVEDVVTRYKDVIKDPDLYRLFQNSYPNTLDTAIKWKGLAANSDEELTFVITGDINAMWLRDSANQMQSYLPLLTPSTSPDSLASLYRGVINLQARYILTAPFCNSFQPPIESGIPPAQNDAASEDTVFPPYSNTSVFECKYELDSLASFLEVSANYAAATHDTAFFAKYAWADAVRAVLDVAQNMTDASTYNPDGSVAASPYTFTRLTSRATETLANDGPGNPVAPGTGLVRSAFRPSDDSTIFQLFVPANMMFASYLERAAPIMDTISVDLAAEMRSRASTIRAAVAKHGVVQHPVHGAIYAFEVDGYGSTNIMDDANIPSLLSAPFIGYLDADDEIYQATRKMVLSEANPYFMRGPVINAVGGPHQGPGLAWPMASIVRILTTADEGEVVRALGEVLASTDGLGLVHESVGSFNASRWTRQWFSWANGLFGQMILDLEERMPQVLEMSFQEE